MIQPEHYPLKPRETVSMATRDGVRLDADVYRPDTEERLPGLLMRQPYGRAIASTVSFAHPSWYARQGYIVVIQDVRGRGTSEGEFRLLEQELHDGFDTVAWAADLPGSTGEVGMYGFSYQGMTQLLAAASGARDLKAICPAMLAYDLYEDFAYENGALRLELDMAWALQLATETARRNGDMAAHQALFSASRGMPLFEAVPARPEILTRYGDFCHYDDWVSSPRPGPYWERISPKSVARAIDLPALHIGGWFDALLSGTLAAYRDMAARCRSPQRLIVGPWVHMPWSAKVGEVDFGPTAVSRVDRMQIRWFDHWLKGLETGILDEPPVLLYEMGGEGWRRFDAWPDGEGETFFLSSSGRAGIDATDGLLSLQSPATGGEDVLVHDPWRPVPSIGGHLGNPHGSVDRSEVDGRSDVLTYTSEPFEEDLFLAGVVTVELWCRADQPSFDVSAVLSDVRPDGRVYNLTQSHARIGPDGTADPLKLGLRAVCCRVPAGHRVRLSLAGACFPAFDINPGTGDPPGYARLLDQRITTLSVSTGSGAPSRLILPLARA